MASRIEMENRIIPYKMLLEVLSTTHEITDRILPTQEIPSIKLGTKCYQSVIMDAIEKAGEGLPVIGYNFAFPSEYLYCFDCVPICIEAASYFLAAFLPEGIEKYYDLINNWGHPYHTCSAQKGAMAWTLDNLFQFDAIIGPTAPCDNAAASYPFFKYKNIPVILSDVPFLHEEKSYKYYGEQIKLALYNLGKLIGQEPNFERMKKHIEVENQIDKIKLEIFELKKAIPSPVENLYNALSAGATIMMSGRPENLDFYNGMLKIVKKRYKDKEHSGGQEKIRSIWPYMLIFFDLALCEWLEREIGMSILFDIFNYNFTDPINTQSDLDIMFEGMAKKCMNFPMLKQSTQFFNPFIDECVKFAKEFNADCFIYTSHIGCKQFGSVPQILREALRDEVGIPMLIIEIDVGDQRMTSIRMVRDKIRMFANTLL
jgi:benzoyl-CoA reductase/2-hydroxyglutaryl-CoA dehydratase subunit BcrC/BadD/HgdB